MNDYERLARSRRREETVETWLGAVAVLGVVAVIVGEVMGCSCWMCGNPRRYGWEPHVSELRQAAAERASREDTDHN